MSYDLMVFDPDASPTARDGFMDWYDQQTQWAEDHSYDNPEVCTPELRAWFLELVEEYPVMNGPHASDDFDNPKLSDYSIGKSVIYIAFSWSVADNAYQSVFNLAKKHRVGFFDVSATNSQVWMPDSEHEYVCVHGG